MPKYQYQLTVETPDDRLEDARQRFKIEEALSLFEKELAEITGTKVKARQISGSQVIPFMMLGVLAGILFCEFFA